MDAPKSGMATEIQQGQEALNLGDLQAAESLWRKAVESRGGDYAAHL